jgi:hypothetical protein
MDSDYSSGGNSGPSSPSSLALSPHPEEENLAPKSLDLGSSANLANEGQNQQANALPGTPSRSAAKRRKLGSPGPSISFDGAHATPPSAIGGGLMPSSPIKSAQKKDKDILPASSQPTKAPNFKGKKKDDGKGGGWEEVLERLGATEGALDSLTYCQLVPL